MSKRPLEESPSRGDSAPPKHLNHNGLLPINDLLSPTPDQQSSSKKPRNFIATVACETCRLKKTRCDESRPKCGLCKSLGLECVYNERKTSKRDHSLTLIMSTLHRLETKLENLPGNVRDEIQSLQAQLPMARVEPPVSVLAEDTRGRAVGKLVSAATPQTLIPSGEPEVFEFDERPNAITANGLVSISFSQHGVVLWPGAREILPQRLLDAHEKLGKNYVIDTEMNRPPLPMYFDPFPTHAGDVWLETLPLAMIKGLSIAFFATFNPFTPIMDKNFYFAFTLGAAIESGFGYTMESCIVLNIMALGCLAVHAHHEGDYPLPGTRGTHFEPPDWMGVVQEEPPGLRFFNEARRRIGFLMCDNDIQSCQFYLLSSVYYSQILRPMDSWAMIHRAATGCLSILTNHDVNFDEWEGDMKSRVFWNCLMNETILVQELHLPPSGLSRFEEVVPIPKFIGFETLGFVPSRFSFSSSEDTIDDSFFQYHFLAQVAHRIILTRIRHSLYFYSGSGTFPHPAVNGELHHQLGQWRRNLPLGLQFSDTAAPFPSTANTAAPSPQTTTSPNTNTNSINSPHPLTPRNTAQTARPFSPAIAVAEAMLRGRYMIAKFHIGRPYLYKALRIPHLLTEDDLEQIRSGLANAMNWPVALGMFKEMRSCIPIKFAFCSQFFGQILLFYCISNSPDPRVCGTLPSGWERWNQEMMSFLEDCAIYSPAVAKDLELLRLL
ncbi:putative C6 finger domain protein [Aspergillus undulatus]|uniref:putative C6 finger domain protein n=1 Tax=Aspergillus undulatus TaxID=1810928 RepID=UPI003CCDD8F6